MKIITLQEPLSREVMAQVREADLVQLPAPLSDLEYASLADVLEQRPSVELRAYDSHIGKFSDVAFLRFFPFLRRLSLDVWSVTDLSGLGAIDDLLTFSLGATKKTFSLRLLKRFKSLRGLLLERQHKDFEAGLMLTCSAKLLLWKRYSCRR
jgi:hypothetical protein